LRFTQRRFERSEPGLEVAPLIQALLEDRPLHLLELAVRTLRLADPRRPRAIQVNDFCNGGESRTPDGHAATTALERPREAFNRALLADRQRSTRTRKFFG
jgi:hypothetical protein